MIDLIVDGWTKQNSGKVILTVSRDGGRLRSR